MKQRLLIYFSIIGCLLCSCETEDIENWLVKKPNGQTASPEELSAGISTIFPVRRTPMTLNPSG